jgi:hypothetical protein
MSYERALTKRIMADLKERHIWAFKVHGSAFQRSGVPDILCCIDGKLIALEIKSTGQTPTPLQVREMRLIKEAGGTAELIYSWPDYLGIVEGDEPKPRRARKPKSASTPMEAPPAPRRAKAYDELS